MNIGDFLYKSTTERLEVKSFTKIYGAYNVNKGYAVFRRIEVLDQNDEYAIVARDTDFGLVRYDHIVRDARDVKEQDILY